MAERLVDVLDSTGAVIHTYPITLDDSTEAADETAYKAKALEAAAHGRLVSDSELGTLTARMHVSRGGQMAPYGDNLAGDSETKASLEQTVRERAYLLWEEDGMPEGRADEYWHRALDQHLRDRAYVLWEQAGRPEGGADEYWRRIRDFEA
jgi:Protein of unknown function (DUF2934)